MQQSVEHRNSRNAEGRLSALAAVHASEPVHPDDERPGDYVIVAQRLCQRSTPGQIRATARAALRRQLRERVAL
ncbi:MAG: hypothetical protein M3401_06120 [Actinomycetota bacterium]|nr:hypothetical protein [Actinomycetota bacterium]